MAAVWSRFKTVLLFERLDSGATMVRVMNGSNVESFEDGATVSTTRLGHHYDLGNEW